MQTSAQRVANFYKRAIEGAGNLNVGAAKRQLLIYKELNILPENVGAALGEFGEGHAKSKEVGTHNILFTGHMIDKENRNEKRFPADMEDKARQAIRNVLQNEKDGIRDKKVAGIAGGACGGDILFHEICEELDIPTEMYLALPREQFLAASVQFAGAQWVKRFDRLLDKLPERILLDTSELPKWLQKKPNYSIWVRNNIWMLESALVNGGSQMTLIALWDGKGGDRPGGSEHMIQVAQEKGATTIVIDTKELFGLKSENATA